MNGTPELNKKDLESILIGELTYAVLRTITQVLSDTEKGNEEAVIGVVMVMLGLNRHAFLHQVADVILDQSMPEAWALKYDFIEDMSNRCDIRAYASYIARRLKTEGDAKDVFSFILGHDKQFPHEGA